ncbi:ABC transporter ATP-binding protein [Candidatus Dojkabacteria bacterium]|uniref:ABC transporter ATP-binding protein n=1 Tax=Candidatus Dojkabacteria bacterium TaxID=2099670 RepID=A0A955I5M3_9BACT|nr:ABC transporter ATP-binding protein [Candidatus Dojkabacteria bacterium]
MISVRNLTKIYKKSKFKAVDDISFNVADGEFFAFLGPNGAGKTTTISILTTTLSKTSGNIEIAGLDIEKDQSEVRRNIGIIFQNPSLDLNLSAEENIRLHAVLYGMYPFGITYQAMPVEYKQKVEELSELMGIKAEMRKPVKSFSGGMKRKLEIIRSLMHDPGVLFLDEPTTGLDPASRKNLWTYLQKVRAEKGTTVFLTTHYLEEAEGADHVAIINNGKIVAEGTPAEIKQNLVREYLQIDSEDNKSLEKELKAGKFKYEKDQGFRIWLDGNGRTAQLAIQQIKTPLTRLEVHMPTLEEAYLEIVDQQQSGS